MKVADVITNECELMQLGIGLDVDENEIKRIISGKFCADTKMRSGKSVNHLECAFLPFALTDR